MFRDLAAQQSVFTGLAGHRDFSAALTYGGSAESGAGLLVSASYFNVLRLTPSLGRLIGPEDEPGVGESAVVVLSYDYWRSRFGGDPDMLWRRLTVNGQRLTVIGVAPRGFTGTIVGFRPQVFVPLTLRWLMEPTRPADQDNRRSYWVYLFARLKPGISREQAVAGINSLYGRILNEVEVPLNRGLPDDVLEQFRRRQITFAPGGSGQSQLPARAGRPLTLLLAATVLVLLIVCVNIANLLLLRGASRAGEMAVRTSIGATPSRLALQLLTEAATLVVIGGALSLPVAMGTLRAVGAMIPGWIADGLATELSPAAMLFAAASAFGALLAFGMTPALHATRADLAVVLKGQSRESPGSRGAARLRAVLVTAQIAISTTLLVLAGLFAQSLSNIARVDLGMRTDSVVAFTISPRASGYAPERATAFYDLLEERLAAEPGVTSVGSARIQLFGYRNWGSRPTIRGMEADPGADNRASTNEVSPGFFRTLSIPLLAGRNFADSDASNAPRVAIVNESFVRKFDLGDEPVGKRLSFGARARDIEIVGVVGDAKYSAVKNRIPPQVFLPRRQDANLDALTFYVRGGLDTASLEAMIPRVVSAIDPQLPVGNLTELERQVRDTAFLDRMVSMLSACLAGLATLLAAIGLYAVLAYSVSQRRRELGLRLALGARPADVEALVLRQVGRVGLVGAAVGLAGAIGAGQAAQAQLFGLSGHDPLVLVAATGLLSVVVAAAGYLPARRAARLAPMEALRCD